MVLTFSADFDTREQDVIRATHTSEMKNIFDSTTFSSFPTGMTWRKLLFKRGSTSKDEVSPSSTSEKFLPKIIK